MKRWLPMPPTEPLAVNTEQTATTESGPELDPEVIPAPPPTPVTCTRCLALILPANAQGHGMWHMVTSSSRATYTPAVQAEHGWLCSACIAVQDANGQTIVVLCQQHTPTPDPISVTPGDVQPRRQP
jgi:hypothetical protein